MGMTTSWAIDYRATSRRMWGGQVERGGLGLGTLSGEEMRLTRFARISLVPPGAMSSLNPVMRVKHQIGDAIRAHDRGMSGRDVEARITELMEWVGLRKD